ncbi:putative DNA single-strand annealing protein RecT-like [Vibrio nigripulchritudo SO65]|uniref:RecT family recombinase n=1 Tax=Vibrio nigripulchritudo TaxID=28173 RepID=UPI0003B19A1E|nr:RecT family recombinase [Vibrio nigripulchritudo]CCN38192.1 putative DNA single-strand annealing protein RecT-like [Vibrio nigripulchritudo AM115]CCN42670.1 putative DNA single-strand annealing protein RecT-like [Vibrio nigripulchritudo FTn2]CCN79066.1 putative DNA single-strand annealing protein RecT-like [Vibrio nigripulchritudo SO65]
MMSVQLSDQELSLLSAVPDNTSLAFDVATMMFNPDLMGRLERFAELMATGKSTIPTHLRGSPGDCLAITIQSMQWRMNPHAVAQKTHLVNGTLGYEAQLVNAVVTAMAPTKDRINYEWFGDWHKVIGKFATRQNGSGKSYQAPNWKPEDEQGLGVRAWATLKGEDEPRVLELLLTQAQVRNSTLWASDPKQQLAYLAVKRWARLHTPDVIMGVYTPDELEPVEEKSINPTPAKNSSRTERLRSKLTADAPMVSDEEETVTLDGILLKIEHAQSERELTEVVADAKHLKNSEQTKARKAYKEQLIKLRALESSEQSLDE